MLYHPKLDAVPTCTYVRASSKPTRALRVHTYKYIMEHSFKFCFSCMYIVGHQRYKGQCSNIVSFLYSNWQKVPILKYAANKSIPNAFLKYFATQAVSYYRFLDTDAGIQEASRRSDGQFSNFMYCPSNWMVHSGHRIILRRNRKPGVESLPGLRFKDRRSAGNLSNFM
jgi:hypothetical protein